MVVVEGQAVQRGDDVHLGPNGRHRRRQQARPDAAQQGAEDDREHEQDHQRPRAVAQAELGAQEQHGGGQYQRQQVVAPLRTAARRQAAGQQVQRRLLPVRRAHGDGAQREEVAGGAGGDEGDALGLRQPVHRGEVAEGQQQAVRQQYPQQRQGDIAGGDQRDKMIPLGHTRVLSWRSGKGLLKSSIPRRKTT
ncbi:hypothetical protein QC826_16395 [Rugamonas sp. DEMB1]|nr:hypothetical protein [Rugamonas sp. DEMB1]WGG48301.1 hypothetical protein QC826_16395 [Rugamonas sp. DEMB1]